MLLVPVPGPPQGPSVYDVADEVEGFGLVVAQEVE